MRDYIKPIIEEEEIELEDIIAASNDADIDSIYKDGDEDFLKDN